MTRTRPAALVVAMALALPVTMASTLPALAEPDSPDLITIGDFEPGGGEHWDIAASGGATGTLTQAGEDPAQGQRHGRLTASIPDGTVEIVRWPGEVDAQAIELSVRSQDVTRIAVRLHDATGQTHQQRFSLTPGSEGWQDLRIEEFDAGEDYGFWGGANDGIWHGPLRGLSIILDSWSFGEGVDSGVLDIDRVVAEVPPSTTPMIRLETISPGNVFTTGEPVTIGYAGEATGLAWTVRDAFGTVVVEDSASAAELDGTVTLAELSTRPGWFEVEVIGTGADGARFTTGTDIAVLDALPADFVRDPRFAVATHYGQQWPLATAALVAEAGFGLGRDEAYWQSQERVPGEIVWEDKVLAYQDEFAELGLGHFRVLSYGNDLYFPDEAPSTPEGRAAFARYAVATVAELGVDGNVFEVWNEWNWRDLDGAAGGSAEQYVELLKVTHDAIKAEFPDALLLGPSLAATDDWQGWFAEFADLGGLDYVDAVSTHPYTYPGPPEGSSRFAGHWQALRGVMADHGHADLPIWLSEIGWPTSQTAVGSSEADQARHLVRGHLVAFADGIENVTIYDFMDDGNDPAEVEHRFGIVRHTGDSRGAWVPKPAYVASAVLTRQLAGLAFADQVDLGDGAWAARYGDAGREVRVAWSEQESLAAIAASGPVTVTDLYGGITELVPDEDGLVHVTLTGDPLYLTGDITAIEASTAMSLEVDPEISGVATAAEVVVDNTGRDADRELAIHPVGGALATGTVPAGQTGAIALSFDPQPSGQQRVYAAVVHAADAPVALLRSAGQPTAALSLRGTQGLTQDSATLRLRVTNSDAAAVTLDGVDISIGGEITRIGDGTEIPAQASTTLELPVTIEGRSTWQATAVSSGGRSAFATGVLIAVADPVDVPARSIVLDGVIDPEIAALEPHTLGEDGAPQIPGWEGPEDLSAQLWLTHDPDHLLVSVRVTDDVHAQPATGGDTWQGDGLQIGLVGGAPGENTSPQELGVALTATGEVSIHRWAPSHQQGVPSGVEAVVVRDEDAATTTYELAIPWSTVDIDAAGRLLSATVVLNENDGDGRDGWLSWGLGVAESKNAALFRALVLGEAVSVPSPPSAIGLRTTVEAVCRDGQAVIEVRVANTGATLVAGTISRARSHRVYLAKPGRTTTEAFAVGQPQVSAGTVTVIGYTWINGPRLERSVHPHEAASCA